MNMIFLISILLAFVILYSLHLLDNYYNNKLKTKTMLKLEELIKDKWYYINTYAEFIFKLSKVDSKNKYIEGSEFRCYTSISNSKTGAWFTNIPEFKELRKATKEEVLKYFPDEKFDDFVKDLIIGEVYVADNGNIFKWGGNDSSHFLGSNSTDNLPNTRYSKGKGSFKKERNRKATQDEIKWLDACIKANKFISKEEALKQFEEINIKSKSLVDRYVKCIKQYNNHKIKPGDYDKIEGEDLYRYKLKEFLTASKDSRTDYYIWDYFELMPEGFTPSSKEDKPKFEVGKWYKISNGYICKAISDSRIEDGNKFYHGDYITPNGKFHSQSPSYTWLFWSPETHEINLSEIQQYLPDGHPDKYEGIKKGTINNDMCFGSGLRKALPHEIPNNYIGGMDINKSMSKDELLAEAKRRYPIGTKFKSCVSKKDVVAVLDDHHFYNGNYIYVKTDKYKDGSCIYDNGTWAEIISIPSKIDYHISYSYTTLDLKHKEEVIIFKKQRKNKQLITVKLY